MRRSRFARSFGRLCERNLVQNTSAYAEISRCRARSLNWYFLVSWSASHSEPLHSAKILEDAVKLVSVRSVSAPLPDNLAHHPIPNCCRNIYTILECASLLGVCCFCHAAHVWTSLLLLHGSQGLSHAGANGLARKSGTFSVLSHTQLNGLSSRKSADDDWEELKLSTFCDVSSVTRCFGGYNVKLIGSTGGSCLIEWANRLQGPQSAISTESHSIEWRRAAKAMLLVNGALDDCRLEPVLCGGYVDNDALRLAVGRGTPGKLGHLRVHTDTCFHILVQLPISLHRVSTTENEADIMTKVLLVVCHRELSKTDIDLDAVPVASILTHAVVCRYAGWQSLGAPEEVFLCSYAAAQLVSKLACVSKSERSLLTTGSEIEFLSRLHQSFAKAALVRYDVSCRCALKRIPVK